MESQDISLLESGDRPFKVRAEDAEDLAVVASYLQDALLPVTEMSYQPGDNRFVMLVQRFKWESVSKGDATASEEAPPYYERVHCAIRFEGVTAVRSQGLDRDKRHLILNLLTLHPTDGQIDVAFADNVTIRLAVDRILCHIEDLGDPWPTVFRPSHAESEEEKA